MPNGQILFLAVYADLLVSYQPYQLPCEYAITYQNGAHIEPMHLELGRYWPCSDTLWHVKWDTIMDQNLDRTMPIWEFPLDQTDITGFWLISSKVSALITRMWQE